MGLNELDSRHKKTTKVSDLSGFSVLGVADFAENSHQFGVDGGSSQIRTVDLRIKSSGAPENPYIKQAVAAIKKQCVMECAISASGIKDKRYKL